MFRSLRWRIAAYYAALFIAVIVVGAFAISSAFRTILINQAAATDRAVLSEIARAIQPPEGLERIGEDPIDLILSDPRNLEAWSSPTTLVQIDNLAGYPYAKSSNTGAYLFPAARGLGIASPERIDTQRSPLGDLLVLDHILISSGRVVAIAHIGAKLDVVEDVLQNARTILFGVSIVGVALVVIASLLIASSATGPINRLSDAMEEIGSDRLDRRLNWTARHDELGRLATAFDRMLDRLQDAFARERQFISDASHELKTPLTVINANAQMLQRWGDKNDEIRRDSLAAIASESSGLAAMVNGMLLLAKADSGDSIPKVAVDLAEIAADAVGSLQQKAGAKGLDLMLTIAPGNTMISGEALLLRQLVTNLIDNAIKFTEQGRIEVGVAAVRGIVSLDVADTGVGIDEESIRRVFDRFYRTDKSRNRAIEGTGLGLAIVRSIARVHGGSVSAARNTAGGTTFSVTLPALPLIIESS